MCVYGGVGFTFVDVLEFVVYSFHAIWKKFTIISSTIFSIPHFSPSEAPIAHILGISGCFPVN